MGGDALDALRASPEAETRPALVAFLNELSQLDGPRVLVLDDLHAITSPVIHEAMVFWLEQLPTAMRVVALTREDPPWPLARWRARGQLLEMRAQDLRFTPAEAETFASQTLPQPVSREAIAQLDARLEGWPAGWRMALTLAAREPQGAASLLAEQLAPQHIVDFFVSEVLAAQSPEIQDFLLRTAFLDRLTGSLCDAVTARNDSQRVLTQLAKGNVFIQQLDADRGSAWFRYHALFAEALRQVARERFSANDLRRGFARASEWFERANDLPEAIDAALPAKDFERAAELIERFLDRQRYGELTTLRRWLEQLPQAEVFSRPELCRAYANLILFSEDRYAPATRTRIEPYFSQAEQVWRAQGAAEKLGELLALRSVMAFWQGDFEENSRLAREALALLPESNAQWRGVCLLQVTGEELHAGRMAELLPLAMEARALCAASANPHAALAALTALGEVSYWRGELRQAALFAEQTLGEATAAENASDRQRALTLLGLIALDQNEIGRAAEHAEQALALGSQLDEPDSAKRAALLHLRIRHAAGETVQAREALRQFIAAERSPAIAREAYLAQARLEWLDGDVASARRALGSLPAAGMKLRLDEEAEALLWARLMLAQRTPDEALRLSREWRDDARQNERARSELEWVLLESLALAQRDDLPRARLALGNALAAGQREGITRPFIEMGERGAPLVALLREAFASPSPYSLQAAAFVTELLTGMDEPSGAQAQHSLAEPLSASEQRVLRLLAAGMTNADIARELTVSVNTVKTQTQSIYRKLNVNSREAARQAARKMRLS
jgi:LuxR family maltose regulon positive regulatory protein